MSTARIWLITAIAMTTLLFPSGIDASDMSTRVERLYGVWNLVSPLPTPSELSHRLRREGLGRPGSPELLGSMIAYEIVYPQMSVAFSRLEISPELIVFGNGTVHDAKFRMNGLDVDIIIPGTRAIVRTKKINETRMLLSFISSDPFPVNQLQYELEVTSAPSQMPGDGLESHPAAGTWIGEIKCEDTTTTIYFDVLSENYMRLDGSLYIIMGEINILIGEYIGYEIGRGHLEFTNMHADIGDRYYKLIGLMKGNRITGHTIDTVCTDFRLARSGVNENRQCIGKAVSYENSHLAHISWRKYLDNVEYRANLYEDEYGERIKQLERWSKGSILVSDFRDIIAMLSDEKIIRTIASQRVVHPAIGALIAAKGVTWVNNTAMLIKTRSSVLTELEEAKKRMSTLEIEKQFRSEQFWQSDCLSVPLS